jgi:NADH:ubiquinone oxidoreductase subunit 3 (subunit A)
MPPPSTIPNNMVLAIVAVVVSLACCLPHGVVSLIFAMQVGKKEAAGDIEGATKAAGQAKLFAWISIIVGVVYFIFAMIFGVFGLIIGALGGGR